ncbi:MAG: DUF1287 domain-containing protein [Pseudomonas sp.]|uniref:DUF1287 domain-containing protein n=1 Tax=Pseudomonas sp. TaxID=306 RepID=UPI0033993C87
MTGTTVGRLLRAGLFALLALPSVLHALEPQALPAAARQQVGVTLFYDPSYRRLAYPGGDVPKLFGVCTDVVIRALRLQGLDLQQAVHLDMREHFAAYPKQWGLRKPDANIDHRRVPNLMTYFSRRGWALQPSQSPEAYRAGDIVTWDLGRGVTHIGILSDRQTVVGVPLVLHNIGFGARENDILFNYPILGHYRLPSP